MDIRSGGDSVQPACYNNSVASSGTPDNDYWNGRPERLAGLDGKVAIATIMGHPPLAALLRRWCLAQATRGETPCRADLEPYDLPRILLPYMFIYAQEGDRFRCRLYGSKLRDFFGEDSTGRYLDEMVKPDAREKRNSLFRKPLESGRPLFYRGFLVAPGVEWRHFNRLLLPVATQPGASPTQIMGALRIIPPPPGLRLDGNDPDGMLQHCLLQEDDCRLLLD